MLLCSKRHWVVKNLPRSAFVKGFDELSWNWSYLKNQWSDHLDIGQTGVDLMSSIGTSIRFIPSDKGSDRWPLSSRVGSLFANSLHIFHIRNYVSWIENERTFCFYYSLITLFILLVNLVFLFMISTAN